MREVPGSIPGLAQSYFFSLLSSESDSEEAEEEEDSSDDEDVEISFFSLLLDKLLSIHEARDKAVR